MKKSKKKKSNKKHAGRKLGKCSKPAISGKTKKSKRKKIARKEFKKMLSQFNKKRKKSHSKKLKGVSVMAKKSGKKAKHHDQIIIMGKKGKHKRAKRHGKFLHGFGNPGFSLKEIGGNTLNVAAGVAGGVGGAYLVNKITGIDAKVKAIIPIVAGVIIASVMKIPALRFAGVGLGIIGGISLIKNTMPGVQLLAGEQQIFLPAPSYIPQQAAMNEIVDMSGSGDAGDLGYVSQADM